MLTSFSLIYTTSSSGTGYGKFVCVDYNQRAFKLAFPRQLEIFATFLDLCSTSPQAATKQKQAYDYYKWSLPLFSREFKRKVHPQLSSDGLLPHSEDFQQSFQKARFDKVSPEVFTKETESSTLKRTIKALKSDSLKGLLKLSSFTELSFPNDPLFQLLTAQPAVTHEAVCDLPLISTYYKTPSVEYLAPHHLLKKDTLKHLSNHTCLHVAYQSAEFFLEKHADLLTKDAREVFTALTNWLLHTQQGFARDVQSLIKAVKGMRNESHSKQLGSDGEQGQEKKRSQVVQHVILEWEVLRRNQATNYNLVSSMPKRLQEVTDAEEVW
ncbi:hypothetical protein Pcinc_026437 [Petrolisthes cinctipes]|uniref:Uncharacterized protein n=1 Tax=Petrolisthes cinctipes TaxID=88211 RepID=A0AAE1F6V7_PETCI|nr:hypothetical protein Pcinc_026437 [Petrolisthes cinctipes]